MPVHQAFLSLFEYLTIIALYLDTMQPPTHYPGTMQPLTRYLGTMQLLTHYSGTMQPLHVIQVLLSRQDASTVDCPNKDGPCCLGQ